MFIQGVETSWGCVCTKRVCVCDKEPGGGNVMGVCLYHKSVFKVYHTEGVYCRYIQYIRISVVVQSNFHAKKIT